MAIIKKITYKDQVIDYVYQRLVEGRYCPGEQLKESLLARDLGISRAPVREALKELTVRGIVNYRPQAGCFIAQPSPQEIVDAYTARGLLEGYAIMTTRQAFTSADLRQLSALVGEMHVAAERGDRKEVVEVGDVFHTMLVSKQSNSQIAEYLERLRLKLHVLFCRYWPELYSPQEIGERHRRIVLSLEAGDAHNIEETVRTHYSESGEKIAALARALGGRERNVA